MNNDRLMTHSAARLMLALSAAIALPPGAWADPSAFVDQVSGAAGVRQMPGVAIGRSAAVGGIPSTPRFDSPRAPAPGGNVAIVYQRGDGNVSVIDQSGSANRAVVEIDGSDGNVTQQKQVGVGNLSGVRIVGGGYNRVTTEQIGNGNVGGFTLEDSTGVSVRLQQLGDGLRSVADPITVSSTGTAGGEMVIEQNY